MVDRMTQNIKAHDTVSVRRIAKLNPSAAEISDLSDDTTVSFVPLDGFGTKGEIKYEEERNLSEVIDGYTYFREGDIAVAKITPSFENGKGAVCESLEYGIGFGTTEIHVLRPVQHIDPHFLWYCLRTKHFSDSAEAAMRGSAGQQRVPGEFLANYEIPDIPLIEQQEISKYLQKQLGKIDLSINIGKKIKDNLSIKIKALTRETITSGIHQSSIQKDSNVGWIGKVPEHWDVVRTRFVARLESGHTPSKSNSEYWTNTNIPWVTTSDIKPFRNGKKIYLEDTENKINELGLKNSGAHLLPKGTVFLSRTASVGFSGIMDQEMATSQDFANWICGDKIIPEYLLYVFRSMDQEFDRLTQGSTHQTIYMPDIESFKTPLPPVEEQQEIVEYIQTESERLWELIEKVNRIIDLLEEKRQALITAAVTSQIDIPDVQDSEQITI